MILVVLEHPLPEQVPYGKPAYVEIPVTFWSDDWHTGLRSRRYLGNVCLHVGGGFCVQPQNYQGWPEPLCIPFDPVSVTITVLAGKLGDYT